MRTGRKTLKGFRKRSEASVAGVEGMAGERGGEEF